MNMPSTCTESESTEPLYELCSISHLRINFKRQLNKIANDNCNSKVNNNDEKSLDVEESFSRLSIQTRRNVNDLKISTYFDRKFEGSRNEYENKLKESTTLYVGNLNYESTESDVRKLFSKAGNIKTVIMGIDRKTRGPGGFCFVEYETREEAEKCVSMEDKSLDGKTLCIDWDAGFTEGRQYTRRRYQRPRTNYSNNQKVEYFREFSH